MGALGFLVTESVIEYWGQKAKCRVKTAGGNVGIAFFDPQPYDL
jgi:hypothetical protein